MNESSRRGAAVVLAALIAGGAIAFASPERIAADALAVAVDRVIVPSATDLQAADAIAIHGGGRESASRERLALALYQRGLAPLLVALGGRLPPGDPDGTYAHAVVRRLLAIGASSAIVDRSEEGSSTNGEVRALRNLARDRGWSRVILVTDRVHARRVAILADGILRPVGVTPTVATEAPGESPPSPAQHLTELARLGLALLIEPNEPDGVTTG